MPSTRISQLLLPLLLLMHAAAVSALPLPAMVADMQDNAAAIASQYDELEQARHLQRNSDSAGWRLFGGVDVGQYRELDRLGRQSYTGSGGHLGLRYPLLGSRQSQHSSMLDGRIALDKARQSTALVRSEQQEQLRLAYIDWWHLHEISAWCERIDRQARSERQLTAERGSKQRLRTSEVLWVEQRWESLLRNCHGLEQHEAVLREHLAYLYGNLLPANARPHPEPLPLEPAVVASWLPLLEQHPALLALQEEEHALAGRRQPHWSDRVEAYFSISQNLERRSDISGNGSGAVAALNFEVPVGSIGTNKQHDSLQARQAAVAYRSEETRRQLHQALTSLLQDYQLQLQQIAGQTQQLHRVEQLLAEQQDRLLIDGEEGFIRLRLARLELAESELELLAQWRAGWRVLAGLHALAGSKLDSVLDGGLLHWQQSALRQAPEQLQPGSRPAWRRAVYIWDSSKLLQPQQRQQQIELLRAAGFNQLYLGFDARQVNLLAELAPQIHGLLAQLHRQGFEVGLLLGDPDWMRPQHRHKLVQLLADFDSFAFDSLHLDLEVEQLGWPVPEQLLHDWLQTMAVASNHSRWPVSIVSHHRWFAAEQAESSLCVPCRLPQLGISEVTIMLYSTASDAVVQHVKSMLAAWPQLDLQLAQSVESQLPAANSWHGSSQGKLAQLEQQLRRQLQPHGLTGLAWQDWQQHPANRKQSR